MTTSSVIDSESISTVTADDVQPVGLTQGPRYFDEIVQADNLTDRIQLREFAFTATCPKCSDGRVEFTGDESGVIQSVSPGCQCKPCEILYKLALNWSTVGIDRLSGKRIDKASSAKREMSNAQSGRRSGSKGKKARYKLEDVKAAARGNWRAILNQNGISYELTDGKHHPCPKCGGTDRCSMVDELNGALLCRKCFDKNNGDGFAALVWFNDWKLNQAVEWVGDYLNVPKSDPGWKIHATYDYHNEAGVLVYQAIEERTDTGAKNFSQRRPDHKGGWINETKSIQKVLYRLPELIAADRSRAVFIPEGEKKVDALRAWGFIATCNVGGAGRNKWRKEYSNYFKGRDVLLMPDNDPVDPQTGRAAGPDFMREIAEELKPFAKSIRVVDLPNLPAKGDIVDWIKAGGTKEQFEQIIHDLSKRTPEESLSALNKQPDLVAVENLGNSSHELAILESIDLEVLGQIEGSGGKVKVFSNYHRNTDVIADIAKLSRERLLQICGPSVKKMVHQGSEEIPGIHTLKDVRAAIALVSGERRIGNDSELGRGVWRGKKDNLEDCDSVVLVRSGEAAKWESVGPLVRITKPRIDGLILDFGGTSSWYDFSKLSELIEMAKDVSWCEDVIEEAREIFSRWSWKRGDAPSVLVGLIMASFMQTLWPWRPQVILTGETNTGKTLLFGTLEYIFGALCNRSSQSSAAGVRQAIKNSGVVVLCDEFDSTKGRQDILDMIRLSSRGDSVLKGTVSQKGQEFSLRHIIWLAGIDSGLREEPDRNRFIMLEAVPPAEEERGKLKTPHPSDLRRLGQKILAITIRYAVVAVERAVALKGIQIKDIHPRVIESYSAPIAISTVARGYTLEQSQVALIDTVISTAQKTEAGDSDKEQLLEFILQSSISLGHGVSQSVAKTILDDPARGSESYDALERHGVATPEGGGLFLAHNMIARNLLRGSRWESQNISEILIRIRGAEKVKRRIAGSHPWGILLPESHISDIRNG